jgi:hypothetical protein
MKMLYIYQEFHAVCKKKVGAVSLSTIVSKLFCLQHSLRASNGTGQSGSASFVP